MEILIFIMLFLSFATISVAVYLIFFSKRIQAIKRVNRIDSQFGGALSDPESDHRSAQGLATLLYQQFVRLLTKSAPKSLVDAYESIIAQSGTSRTLTPASLQALQIISAAAAAILVYFLVAIAQSESYSLVVLSALMAFTAPYMVVRSRALRRRYEVQKTLPDILDILYVSVEAGLGFDTALRRVTERGKGALREELRWVLDDISKGRERGDAFRAILKRIRLDDLNAFVTAIIQSEQLGTNIGSMLRIQSNMIRTKRRQRVEEASKKLAVKMTIPLVFCFTPVIFIITLGPGILNLIDTFKDLFTM